MRLTLYAGLYSNGTNFLSVELKRGFKKFLSAVCFENKATEVEKQFNDNFSLKWIALEVPIL